MITNYFFNLNLSTIFQSVTEAALYEVQPQDSYLNARNRRAIAPRIAPPTDLRHGLQLGYGLVTDVSVYHFLSL